MPCPILDKISFWCRDRNLQARQRKYEELVEEAREEQRLLQSARDSFDRHMAMKNAAYEDTMKQTDIRLHGMAEARAHLQRLAQKIDSREADLIARY